MNYYNNILKLLLKLPNNVKIRIASSLRILSDDMFFDFDNEFRRDMFNKLDVNKLFCEEKKSKVLPQFDKIKIKVCIYHVSTVTWNAINSVYESFSNDPQYDIIVVLWSKGKRRELERQMKEHGIKYLFDDELDGYTGYPDIFITYHLFIEYTQKIIKMIKPSCLVINIAMTVILEGDIFEHVNQMKKWNSNIYTDYYLVEKRIYTKMLEAKLLSEDIILMGNPKFDDIFLAYRKEVEIPSKWKKLEEKRIVLWTTDHGLNQYSVTQNVSFDLYAKTIFSFCLENPNIALIFRPHPSFLNDLLSRHFWNDEYINQLKSNMNETENFIWDDTDNYKVAYSMADAIISDVECGILCSALPLKKPIAVLERNDITISPSNLDLLHGYYQITDEKKCIEFLQMVIDGRDPMYNDRVKQIKENVLNFDGENGKRIKEFIESKMKDKI